ncbi:S9 family peptidase [Thermoflavifilum thermophilum]|uniref:Dipeptidyl-peptidase-4 n=1 Tax=Thermoflavifilum thermophilum TaxID=1393122 RepID=A0A1I7N3P6_9BACT|nr:DPP IV N-terminal domain-containing protein [Thermoflavifilum thermophilum]SFV29278.1 dipeptidyl-peptidase-4 [Thermoflavifilum thermophilum]
MNISHSFSRMYWYSMLVMCGMTAINFSCTSTRYLSKSTYQRAEQFERDSIARKVYHLQVVPHWYQHDSAFWFVTNTRSGERFFKVLIKDTSVSPLFDQSRLSDSLSSVLHKHVDSAHLPIQIVQITSDHGVFFRMDSSLFHLNLSDYSLSKVLTRNHSDPYIAYSPDSNWIAFHKEGNLFLVSTVTHDTIQLSFDGNDQYTYASYYGWSDIMYGENGKRPDHFTVKWSPDSRYLFTQICDTRSAKKMYLLNWSVDSLYRAQLMSYYRGSPGDTDVVKYIPVIFDIDHRKLIHVKLPPIPHFIGIDLTWTRNGDHLYGTYYHRGYKKLDFIDVNASTGDVRVVCSDSSDTYVENNFIFRYLENKQIAFFSSERTGWKQLYEVQWNTGKIIPVTRGNFVVKELLRIDTVHEILYFTASGREKGVNPYDDFLYSIHFDGTQMKCLTPESAHHEIYIPSRGDYFVDNYSTPTQPTISVLRRLEDGAIIMPLGKADISDLLAMGWHFPQIFTTIARDGKTILYGALWKPTHFNPHHKYPIIDDSYTGPQTFVFPRSFTQAIFNPDQSLAECGFIVMKVDGLGTAGRSKAFHNWSYRHMGDNLLDHVLSIRQLADRYHWIDTTRIGIFGHSAGGYDAAHALMRFPGFYKVAVAESGDHDWRMEKAWWPEMYVGWPVDSIYAQQSNITLASHMEGKLLLIHGGIDENVNPASTFKLAHALIKAGKYFDMLIIPDVRHGYPPPFYQYVEKKMWNYFIENLLKREPLE